MGTTSDAKNAGHKDQIVVGCETALYYFTLMILLLSFSVLYFRDEKLLI